MKRFLVGMLRMFGVRNVIYLLGNITRGLAAFMTKIQFLMEWGKTPTPEWFDHNIDKFVSWGTRSGNCFWLERGVFSNLAISSGANVLELCCGDGFNAKHFYSYRAAKITSCDFDANAIRHAKECNWVDNVEFVVADIRCAMPGGDKTYDNIVWDAAIEHFTPEEIKKLMKDIKSRLNEKGILSGYTIVERADGKSLEQHEYEFKSKEDLMRFLTPWFKNVKVFETIYPDRHNLYFYASDDVLPFSSEWQNMINNQDL